MASAIGGNEEPPRYDDETENLIRTESMTVLIIGKSGVGKSSLINAFLNNGEKVRNGERVETAASLRGVQPQAHDTIEVHEEVVEHIPVKMIDTNGIRKRDDCKKIIRRLLKDNINFSLVLICINITDRLEADALTEMLKSFESTYGEKMFWGRVLIVFTFTNRYEREAAEDIAGTSGLPNDMISSDLKERIKHELYEQKNTVYKMLKSAGCKMPDPCGQDPVPYVHIGRFRSGTPSDRQLLVSPDWFKEFLEACVKRSNDEITKIQLIRLAYFHFQVSLFELASDLRDVGQKLWRKLEEKWQV